MTTGIAVARPAAIQPDTTQASGDDQLVKLCLHGRSLHTRRAYRADVERFRGRAGKGLRTVTLADLQDFASSLPAARRRAGTAPSRP